MTTTDSNTLDVGPHFGVSKKGEGYWVCKMELAQSHILMLESGHAGLAVEISRKSHGAYSQETSGEKQTQLAKRTQECLGYMKVLSTWEEICFTIYLKGMQFKLHIWELYIANLPYVDIYMMNQNNITCVLYFFLLSALFLRCSLRMKDAILEGGNQFQRVHGMSLFQYMDKDPAFNIAFNKSMADLSTIALSKILEVYQGFVGLTSLVDVGGGTGKCLNMVISKYPSIKGINFDLPHVIQSTPSYPGIEHVGGDMFHNIPKGDAIVMKNILHDWNDENCKKILRTCYKALPDNGKVVIIELLMPEATVSSIASQYISHLDMSMLLNLEFLRTCYKALPDNGKVVIIELLMPEATVSSIASQYISHLDMSMLLNLEGQERTEKEFEALCKESGFSSFQVVFCAYTLWAVMEFHK
ncbi:caffeic acid 3-o-methyltransferase [Quercus suber]|uniref:Caffeic acid 3-o-methyltransferase n=2 Tax=Quercus suber TaxID=58331 RepID=A0AAW0K3E4_QUESU